MVAMRKLWMDNTKTLKARYFIVGLWNTVFGLVLFLLLLNVFSYLNYSMLLVCSFLISTGQSHFMQRRLVWKSKARYGREFLKFLGVTSGTFLINLLALPLLVEVLNWPVYRSQILLVICLTLLGYFYQKYHVFKPHPQIIESNP
jgi:putative flippase GtrA